MHPHVFLVVPVVLLGGFVLWRRTRQGAPGIPVPSAGLLQALPRTTRERLRSAPLALRLIALASLLVALAGPQAMVRERREEPRGADIALVLDVSRSMLAQDLEPNRLGAAKRVAEALVASRPRDRFAVVTFAGDVQANCPLTLDHIAVTRVLRAAHTERRSDGTALGPAIAQGVSRVGSGAGGSRAIVLFTDGAGNTGPIDPARAAAFAATQAVRIFTVGIGSTRPVPYPTEFGAVTVPLAMDEGTLQRVAWTSDGHYFRATDARSLDRLLHELDRFEPDTWIVRTEITPVNFSYGCALFALLCVATERALAFGFCRTFP